MVDAPRERRPFGPPLADFNAEAMEIVKSLIAHPTGNELAAEKWIAFAVSAWERGLRLGRSLSAQERWEKVWESSEKFVVHNSHPMPRIAAGVIDFDTMRCCVCGLSIRDPRLAQPCADKKEKR